MTSYQRRKQDIAYLEQCVEELQLKAKELAKQIKQNGGEVLMTLGSGIADDKFITPYNNGAFDMDLMLI